MKRITLLSILLCIVAAANASSDGNRWRVTFFGSPTCKDCMHIKKDILFPARKKYPNMDLAIHDITTDSGFNILIRMEETYKVPVSSAIELFFPDTFLTGADDITTHAPRLIAHYASAAPAGKHSEDTADGKNYSERLAEKFRSYSIVSILVAGIIDGVNPCAIATMIFLISFLATQKRKRSEVLVIGLSFTAAVFLTYLAMGIGAFKALTFLQKYGWISTVIRWGAGLTAFVIGVLSFIDAWNFRKTGKTRDIKLQLPKAVKLRIHRVITGNLSGRSLIAGAVVTGFLVTLLEAVCTGQVYLPTIVLMTKQKGMRLTGWFFLIIYNFLFVLPLLIVMVLAFFGMTWNRLATATQKNMAGLKTALGFLLCGLGVFIIIMT
jgi:cytochrome c biogenesis protein CcdA